MIFWPLILCANLCVWYNPYNHLRPGAGIIIFPILQMMMLEPIEKGGGFFIASKADLRSVILVSG